MPDIEKVLKGLEAHAAFAGCSDNCPYWGRETLNCSEELAADAFALLKAQQPGVLTVDEAMNKDCWYESKQGGVRHAIIKYIDEMHVEIKSCNEEYSVYRLTDGYGKYWRCWNKQPTDKQRREAKWDV